MNTAVKILNRAGASFPVRRIQFDFSEVPEYWVGNSAGLTHFMTALSALFPAGEQFFIDSVRAVRQHPKIKNNEALQKEISAFIGQEAMHTHEHVGFNQSAQKYGHDVKTLEKWTEHVIQAGRITFGKVFKPFGFTQEMIDLTGTTALEHFTATIAYQLLVNKDLQDLMHDDVMKNLWLWHAVEENEHKAVVYDVYEEIFGKNVKGYSLRIMALMIAMSLLMVAHNGFTLRLLAKDGKLNFKELKMIYQFAYSPKSGLYAGIVKEMLAYFRPTYHPNDHDSTSMLDKWKNRLNLV